MTRRHGTGRNRSTLSSAKIRSSSGIHSLIGLALRTVSNHKCIIKTREACLLEQEIRFAGISFVYLGMTR